MKRVVFGLCSAVYFVALCAIGAFATSGAAVASVVTQPGNQTLRVIVPSVPTTGSARRTGPNSVHVVWTPVASNVRHIYLFHFTTSATPPADFAKGGWFNDTIVDPPTVQANLSVPPATKPNHNYYLICVNYKTGDPTAYSCSAVINESINMAVPAPYYINH